MEKTFPPLNGMGTGDSEGMSKRGSVGRNSASLSRKLRRHWRDELAQVMRPAPSAMTNTEITDLLRRRIVADLHLGRLKPGARLPSLRMIAQELNIGVDAVAFVAGS